MKRSAKPATSKSKIDPLTVIQRKIDAERKRQQTEKALAKAKAELAKLRGARNRERQ